VALARPDHYARRAVRTVAYLLADVGAQLMHPDFDRATAPATRVTT
jgi:hypothetical protein